MTCFLAECGPTSSAQHNSEARSSERVHSATSFLGRSPLMEQETTTPERSVLHLRSRGQQRTSKEFRVRGHSPKVQTPQTDSEATFFKDENSAAVSVLVRDREETPLPGGNETPWPASCSSKCERATGCSRSAPCVLLLDYSRPVRVTCGIRMIWVGLRHRRKGIASALLDAVRRHFLLGYTVPHCEVAFSQMTEDGLRFAEAYVSSGRFCVYE